MERESAYRRAIDRGLAYLLSWQHPDGGVSDPRDGVDPFCKLIYALSVAGRATEAHRLADWVSRHAMTPDGDFTGMGRKGTADVYANAYTYAGSWLVIGA